MSESETHLDRIAEVLVRLGADSSANIDSLTRHCGEILKADCALYTLLDRGVLSSVAAWNLPDGFCEKKHPAGTICNDVITGGSREVRVVRKLGHSRFARSDVNVEKFGFETFLGCPVYCNGVAVGVVSVFYQKDFEPSFGDLRILDVIGSALGREEERKAAESLLRLQALVLDQIEDRVTVTDLKGVITYVNDAELRALGHRREELIGFPTSKYGEEPGRGATQREILEQTLREGRWQGEVINKTKDGRELIMDCRTQLVYDERGEARAICGVASDISERKRVESALIDSEKRYESIYNNMRIGIFRSTPQGQLVWVNNAMVSIYGFSSQEELLKRSAVEYYTDSTDRQRMLDLLEKEGRAVDFVSLELKKDGTAIWISCDYQAVRDDRGNLIFIDGLVLDITDRKKLEAAREKLQGQLMQAQKMESVGRLAGGVAHDFNNMLGVIIGHTEMILKKLPQEHPIRANLMEIENAADRSAQLTRQLLSFARKQTIAPRLLDLNTVVSGMLSMLRRLIGEDISLSWKPGRNMGQVKIDPAQIDQILANLCVNARDAIDNTGHISIETQALIVSEDCGADHAGIAAGDYVMLTVKDDGCGMSSEILEKLFEPFFTTKETGKGTGLGLATVYGIVKQNRGFITVQSEPGNGSCFCVYFPVSTETLAIPDSGEQNLSDSGGQETILLVEDEPAILSMTTLMLERLGYVVLPASSPSMALKLAEIHKGQIDLQITDVVMPEMNGYDLSERLSEMKPEMKVLFISGYTADTIAHHGVLDEGVHFLQKPFTMNELALSVRKALVQ